jgi:hypothetical protein
MNNRKFLNICTAVLTFCILFVCCKCKSDTPIEICTNVQSLKMPEGYLEKNCYTLIFLDYTDKNIMGQKAMKNVQNAIEQYLISPNDRIDIYLITANTATRNSEPEETFTLSIKPRAALITDATLDSVGKSRFYACNRLQMLDSFKQVLHAMLNREKLRTDTMKYAASDIVGLFEVANREFGKYGTGVTKTLYIISDMEQNTPGFFELNNTHFSVTGNIAQGNAVEDFNAIIKKSIKKEPFDKVIVKRYVGDKAEEKNNSDVQNKLNIYWKALFGYFGLNFP